MRRGLTSLRLYRVAIAAVTCALLGIASPVLAQDAPLPPDVATEPQGFVPEPAIFTRAALFADRHFGKGEINNGLYLDFANMIPGAGWLSAGPGYRHWYKQDRVFVDGSYAVSWNLYQAAQGRIELPRLARSRLAVGTQVHWHDFDDVAWFGEGPESVESARGVYRVRSTQVSAYAAVRPVRWMAIGTEVGWMNPSIRHDEGLLIPSTPDDRTFMPSQLSVTVDTRDFPSHPTRGALLRAAAAHYDDRDGGAFTFNRYDGEAAGFVPLAGGRMVIALRGWLVSTDAADGRSVPFYLQPALGGGNTLRSYADYRFHDRHLLLATTELRVPLMTHVDAAAFVDAGNVAARVKDLDLDKRSYGAGLRLHTRRTTFARMDVAGGDEGWRVILSVSDPLHFWRLTRRHPAMPPFVP